MTFGELKVQIKAAYFISVGLGGLQFLWVFSFVLCLFLIGQLMSLISQWVYSMEAVCPCVSLWVHVRWMCGWARAEWKPIPPCHSLMDGCGYQLSRTTFSPTTWFSAYLHSILLKHKRFATRPLQASHYAKPRIKLPMFKSAIESNQKREGRELLVRIRGSRLWIAGNVGNVLP